MPCEVVPLRIRINIIQFFYYKFVVANTCTKLGGDVFNPDARIPWISCASHRTKKYDNNIVDLQFRRNGMIKK